MSAKYASFDTYELGLVQNIPLLVNKLSTRLTIERKYSKGSVDYVTLNRDDWYRNDVNHYRSQIVMAT